MNQNRIQEIIQHFTINLNQQAKVSQLKLIGRETQIKQLTYILSRLIKNNPLLIGPPGVGKTEVALTIAEQLFDQKKIGNLVAQGIITNLLRPEGQYCLEVEKESNQIKLTRLSLLEPKKD